MHRDGSAHDVRVGEEPRRGVRRPQRTGGPLASKLRHHHNHTNDIKYRGDSILNLENFLLFQVLLFS